MMNSTAQLKSLSRQQKAELIPLLQERKRRQAKASAFNSYAGFIEHFSEEPEPARHHNYLIEKLDQVAKGEITRLMIFQPPGTAKSTYTSVLFPPYWLERNPGKMIIGTSHDGGLAAKFGRKVRNIVGGDEYREVFDTELSPDSRAADRWETDKKSEYYAVGVGGSVTGRRGHLGLIDDPVKGKKEARSEHIQNDTYEWYVSDFRTRLLPGSPIIIIQTRWVEYDLAGRILPEDYDGRSGPVLSRDGSEVWEVINLPMEAIHNDILGREPGELLWPELYDEDWVAAEKRVQGSNWNALYQQNPVPDEGDYYRREDFNWYNPKKLPQHLTNYVAGDYAVTDEDAENAKPDYTEIYNFAVSPDDRVYITDYIKEMAEIVDWVPKYIKMLKRWKPIVAIGETGVIRRAVEPSIKRQMRDSKAYARLEWLPHNQGDKPAMGRSFQALVRNGLVYLPEGEQWAQDLVDQLCKFPNGAYDDGADACALFGRWIDKVWSKKVKKDEKKKRELKGRPKLTIGDLHG